MNTKELSVTDAVKTFSSERGTPVRALNSVNLTIPTGSHVAIMGPSGSGKSTLLHCMSGILPLDAGTVMVAGTNLAALREKQRSKIRREHMGFVFQDGALLPELTNEENVAMPLLLAGMSLPSALPHAREWLVRLGLADAARRRPGQISGGQAQRVAIARAMVASPAVVFADEPTGALDSLAAEQTMQALTSATRAAHPALLIITHDPSLTRCGWQNERHSFNQHFFNQHFRYPRFCGQCAGCGPAKRSAQHPASQPRQSRRPRPSPACRASVHCGHCGYCGQHSPRHFGACECAFRPHHGGGPHFVAWA